MVKRYPLFGCTSCYEDCSWPADDLREHEGELWCDLCWDGADMRETTGMDWGDLNPFVSNEDKEIAELEAQIAELKEALEESCYLLGIKDLKGNWTIDPYDIDQTTPGQRRIAQSLAGKGGE